LAGADCDVTAITPVIIRISFRRTSASYV